MKSFVTTKNGDAGTTRLISGEIVSKDHPAVVCTGVLDCFRAELARLRLRVIESGRSDANELGDFLFWLLHVCFLVGTQVNDPKRRHPEYRIQEVGEAHLTRLEAHQAQLEAGLNIPRQFIVSATSVLAAETDCCATHARELERAIVALQREEPQFDAVHLLCFVNRLSDYLVVLARHLEDGNHLPVDYTVLGPEGG
ncbi:MAG: hypothetical protein GC168_05345 [Candidatus Hydrogenedens sp.]|nr:hypothetical protein [Candidatus Hydrogenedens sp.]